MIEKEELLKKLIEQSGKTEEELTVLISDKVNELSGLVSEEGAMYIVANELGIKLEIERPKREVNFLKIDKITESKVPVSLICKVIKKYDKINFTSQNGTSGSVQSVLIGDETGIKRLTFWNDQTDLLENIHEGDILKINNAYTRENSQYPERIDIHYGQYSDIEVNPEGVEVDVIEFNPNGMEFTDKKISELEVGDKNIRINASIVDFEVPRFYIACPNCFKKVLQNEDKYICQEHGEVEPIKIPIVNLVIDDGTTTIPVVGFRDRAEKATKLTSDELISLIEDVEKYGDFRKALIGSKIVLVGNVVSNPMSEEIQLILNSIESLDFDEKDILRKDKDGQEQEQDKNKNEKEIDDTDNFDKIEIEEIDIDDDI